MSSSDMRKTMLKLMGILSHDIIATEAMANELAGAALALSDQPEAIAIRDIAVSKRVRVIELQGKLAALREDYAARFPLKL
ncbi:hypothetical protein [Methylobacterium sp. WL2]|uniref:hypothetical protein n=2 Tax=unclassified Methylobacterium TaxID=2615210 RepID=UPI001AED5D4A|nr:hypothetical protein [Methylobacterium sp. WL2]